jgi:hypothetical protein
LRKTVEHTRGWLSERAVEAKALAALKLLRDRGHLDESKKSS